MVARKRQNVTPLTSKSTASAAPVDKSTDDTPPPVLKSIRRGIVPASTLDPSKKLDYTERFRPHGLTLRLHESSLARLCYWRLELPDGSWSVTTGFDVDLDRALAQLEAGCAPHRIDLTFHAAPEPARANHYGAHFCVMCGESGGLPCPKMVDLGVRAKIAFAFPVNDARFVPKHVHPGRCRARLKQLGEAFKARGT